MKTLFQTLRDHPHGFEIFALSALALVVVVCLIQHLLARKTLRDQMIRAQRLAQDKAVLEKRLAVEADRASRLPLVEDQLTELRSDNVALKEELSRYRETLSQERRRSDERIAELNAVRATMTNEFKVLADGILKSQADTFTRQNKEQVETILNPLKEKLTEFRTDLSATREFNARERARLAEQIRSLSDQSARLSLDASNLTKALTGKSQTQGAWGEMILESILEKSGLRRGEEYVTQETIHSDEGDRLRPDVTVRLPNENSIIIDSKVSLTAFVDYVNCEDEDERTACLDRHTRSVLTHIKTLGDKRYHAAGRTDLDYVIMFVPIEGALAAAVEHAPTLIATAAERNVVIATPTTLVVMLKTVASIWQVERRNKNAEDIAKRAGLLYDKFCGFATDLLKVGRSLDAARDAYDESMKKLHSGRGNITTQVSALKDMGARTSKTLPLEIQDDDLDLAPSGDNARLESRSNDRPDPLGRKTLPANSD